MLSKNFYLSEFTASATADDLGIDNNPTQEHLIALTALCTALMQPIRTALGRCVITSGYRSSALNIAVGGSQTSEHALGAACDFTVDGMDVYDTCQWIIDSGLEFNQLIYEKKGENVRWCHLSYDRTGGNKQEVLTADIVGGKASYVEGLHR